jgi:hypothetical protein
MAEHTISSPFRLPLVIEQVEDGTDLATGPALDSFLVQADTIEEIISIGPDDLARLMADISDIV